ncbi:unnamed protein product [Staurois parvus]|uniref:Uncharacterized protein n=1 Tax=Staurois parvus TaxID=386267 RepID=A0ABN9E3R6_9NEOB|nr:unnamed protein product [Staurois parvus]
MTGPRSRRTNHKAQRFSLMRTGHPAVKPSAHTTEAGKTARGWIEEQVRSKNNSAEVRAGTCQI